MGKIKVQETFTVKLNYLLVNKISSLYSYFSNFIHHCKNRKVMIGLLILFKISKGIE